MTDYEDILHAARPVSRRHPPMPREKRAAQFMPFAALSGYEEAIGEAARRTEPRPVLDEGAQAVLDAAFRLLAARAGEHPRVRLTRFLPDPVKPGGRCVEVRGTLRRVDGCTRQLVFQGGERVPMDDVVAVDCDLLRDGD